MAAMTSSTVGPDKWKESTINTIKVAQTLMLGAQDSLLQSKRSNPLPSLKDTCITESNKRIHCYARASRDVVIRLKQVIAAVNEEIKALNRVKQQLKKSLDYCRKDISLNSECVGIRNERPTREQCPSDKADYLLRKEHEQLLQHKIELEATLLNVQGMLQVLSVCRCNLTSIMQERSRATELICHSVSTQTRSPVPAPSPRHIKSLSAPPIIQQLQTTTGNNLSIIGPLNPLTPVTVSTIEKACDSCKQSTLLRTESLAIIEQLKQAQLMTQHTVNNALIQKVAETVTLGQHLCINNGEAKMAQQKSLRLLKQQEKSLGYLSGPVMYNDITKRERLDRPLVRVYQQHPGTDLPEAAHLVQATGITMDSITQTQRNISLLKLARKKLKEDYRDKKLGTQIDSNVVRLRRRKADHRWVVQGSRVTLQLPVKV